jgi:lipopolysaccharide transport system ATP-binding protein
LSKSLIKVQNLSKRYRLGLKEKQADTLAGQIGNLLKSPWQNLKLLRDLNRFGIEDESVFWALKDVSFEVKEGEVLGIIGKNGAGKSTLLKILSQITEPTSGKIEVFGRVASLLEVGTGFHPELSGRENIYMNGTILGMTRREIDYKLDEIVDFSGIEKFIDTPVKFYSSGMKVRLGFSVAAHLDPEILIIDEVLAVGDYEFQKKCLGKMEDVSKNQGRTVLFVSHNLQAVKSLCNSSIHLSLGKIIEYGRTDKVLVNYLAPEIGSSKFIWKNVVDRKNKKPLELEEIKIQVLGKQPNLVLAIDLFVKSNTFHKTAFVAIDIHAEAGGILCQSIPEQKPFIEYFESLRHFKLKIDIPSLIPGVYLVSTWIGSHFSQTIDWKEQIVSFEIVDPPDAERVYPYQTNRGYFSPRSIIYLNED